MASQGKPSSPLFQSISKPFERSPAWVKILYWCVLGAVSAVLVATLISCPILLLLRFLYPGDFQTVLTQNQGNLADTTLTPAPISSPVPGGTTGSSTPSPGTEAASDGVATNSASSDGSQTDGPASSLSPTSSSESGTDSSSSSATGTAASDGSTDSATPSGTDSSSSSGSDSESSSAAGTPSDGGSTASTTPDTDSTNGTSSQSTSAADSAALTATASLIEPSPTSTPIPPSPTLTPTPTPTVPTATPTPRGPTPPPRRTPAPRNVITPGNPAPPPTLAPLPTNTPRATSTPTPATPTRVAVQPVSTRIVAPAAAPNLPSGILTLIDPISIQIPPSRGPTTFVWEWVGDPLPPEYGFEVRVWLNGEPPAGVHDAVLDRQEGRIDYLGANRYQLKVGNIRYAKGVLGREGIYNWTVAVVRVSPAYTDFGLQAVPARFRYEPFPVGR